ncbi:phosphocarrier protein of PTS system [Lachnospiraceae bacterium KM106-2]|nr:phosphocarrier protein of PTS system [Lachnospiraceae bacterium KM106-2]
MKTFKYTITDPQGMHARPAGALVKEATAYQSEVKIERDGMQVDAKRIFGIMGLGIKAGQEVVFHISGEDEEEAAAGLESFMKGNL